MMITNEHLVPDLVKAVATSAVKGSHTERFNALARLEAIKSYCEHVIDLAEKNKK